MSVRWIQPSTSVVLDLHPDVLWDRVLDLHGWPRWLPGVTQVRAGTNRLGPTTTGGLCLAGLWLPFSVRRFAHLHGFSLRIAGVPGVSVWVEDTCLTLRGLPAAPAVLRQALQDP